MAKKTQYSKIKIKRSSVAGVIPTMGPSTDHTDGSWGGTDIYPGEFFINLADQLVWFGTLAGPILLALAPSTVATITGDYVDNTDPLNPVINKGFLMLKGRLNQAGSADPTAIETINEFGTYSLSRLSQGVYELETLSSPPLTFAADKVDFTYCFSDSAQIVSAAFTPILTFSVTSSTTIKITTHTGSGALDDDILLNTYFSIVLFD